MTTLAVICQVIIALGIVNVWILRRGQATRWRPEGAHDMAEEFRRYGYPDWMRAAVGAAKLVLAALLVAGIWVPVLAAYAAVGMAALMAGAVASHFKIGDPAIKSLPSFVLLLLSIFIAWVRF